MRTIGKKFKVRTALKATSNLRSKVVVKTKREIRQQKSKYTVCIAYLANIKDATDNNTNHLF